MQRIINLEGIYYPQQHLGYNIVALTDTTFADANVNAASRHFLSLSAKMTFMWANFLYSSVV